MPGEREDFNLDGRRGGERSWGSAIRFRARPRSETVSGERGGDGEIGGGIESDQGARLLWGDSISALGVVSPLDWFREERLVLSTVVEKRMKGCGLTRYSNPDPTTLRVIAAFPFHLRRFPHGRWKSSLLPLTHSRGQQRRETTDTISPGEAKPNPIVAFNPTSNLLVAAPVPIRCLRPRPLPESVPATPYSAPSSSSEISRNRIVQAEIHGAEAEKEKHAWGSGGGRSPLVRLPTCVEHLQVVPCQIYSSTCKLSPVKSI
ncbi:hypothetical protein B296_00012530, partial [Ensete ventricosum]